MPVKFKDPGTIQLTTKSSPQRPIMNILRQKSAMSIRLNRASVSLEANSTFKVTIVLLKNREGRNSTTTEKGSKTQETT